MIVAHAGHWLVNLAFALPAVAFIAWLAVITIRDRRGGGGEALESASSEPESPERDPAEGHGQEP